MPEGNVRSGGVTCLSQRRRALNLSTGPLFAEPSSSLAAELLCAPALTISWGRPVTG